MKFSTIIVLLLLACSGCNQKVNTQKEGEELMQISRAWSRSVSPDSVDRVMSVWADDAIYMPPGQSSLIGKEAIRQMVSASLKIPGFKINWEPQSVSVSESGDMAYLIEKSQITMIDSLGNSKTEFYKAVTVWRKEKGTWKNVVEIVNTDPKN